MIRCYQCRYWDPIDLDKTRRTSDDWTEIVGWEGSTPVRVASRGSCHRHAPAPVMMYAKEDDYPRLFWPMTNAYYWCGEAAPVEPRVGREQSATFIERDEQSE